jgi:hypothetical protein
MKVFICSCFKGHNPVGVGAVMIAEDKARACAQLAVALACNGLPQDITPDMLDELYLDTATTILLTDGEY